MALSQALSNVEQPAPDMSATFSSPQPPTTGRPGEGDAWQRWAGAVWNERGARHFRQKAAGRLLC